MANFSSWGNLVAWERRTPFMSVTCTSSTTGNQEEGELIRKRTHPFWDRWPTHATSVLLRKNLIIRDRIVCGVRESSTWWGRNYFKYRSFPSIDKCMDMCSSSEATSNQLEAMAGQISTSPPQQSLPWYKIADFVARIMKNQEQSVQRLVKSALTARTRTISPRSAPLDGSRFGTRSQVAENQKESRWISWIYQYHQLGCWLYILKQRK